MAVGVFTFQRIIATVTTAQLLLQIKSPTKGSIEILKAWLDGDVTADETLDWSLTEVTVAATVTAAVAADIQPHSLGKNDSDVALGTAATGYDASVAPTSAPIIRMSPSILIGGLWHPTPEERLVIHEDDILGLELENTIVSQSLIAGITFREL